MGKVLSKKASECGNLIVKFANKKNSIKAFKYLKMRLNKIPGIPKAIALDEKDFDKEFVCEGDRIRKLLDQLLEEKALNDIDEIHHYITCYNFTCRALFDVNKNGAISEIREFNRERSTRLDTLLSFCLINFFKKGSKLERKYIHRCLENNCRKYFISEKIDKRIKYCPICSIKNRMTTDERRQYDKDKRYFIIEKRIEDEMNKLYKRMKGQGYTEEVAKNDAKEYMIEKINGQRKLKNHVNKLTEYITLTHKF